MISRSRLRPQARFAASFSNGGIAIAAVRAGNVFGPMFARCLHRLLVVASYSSVTMSDLEQSVLKCPPGHLWLLGKRIPFRMAVTILLNGPLAKHLVSRSAGL